MTFRQSCTVMEREHTHKQHLSANSTFPSCFHCITLVLSLACELLIRLYVKMTLARSISSVALSLRMEVSYGCSQLIWQGVRGYHSGCCDSSTLAYSWRVESHFTGVLKYPKPLSHRKPHLTRAMARRHAWKSMGEICRNISMHQRRVKNLISQWHRG